MRARFGLRPYRFGSPSSDGGMYFMKSWKFDPVADKTLARLCVLGQRCLPSRDHLLLLLNVVGSSPLFLAKPEQEKLCAPAKHSMAFHIESCVISSLHVTDNIRISNNAF